MYLLFLQYADEWLLTLDRLLVDLNANLVPVLQFVTVDRTLVPRILDNIVQDTQVDSCELIASLMQVHVFVEVLEHAVKFH